MLMSNYTTAEVIEHYGLEFVDKLQQIIDASENRHNTPSFRRSCSCPALEALKAIPVVGMKRFNPDRDGDQHP